MNHEEFKENRKRADIKTAKLAAEKSGTPYSTWIRWEKGISKIPNIAINWLKLYEENKKLKKINEIIKEINQ